MAQIAAPCIARCIFRVPHLDAQVEKSGEKEKTQKSYEWQKQTLENMMSNNLLRSEEEIGTVDIDSHYITYTYN